MLRITQLNASGFSGANAGDGSATLPDAYETVDNFTIDIKFEGKYPTDTVDPITGQTTTTYQYANASNVTSSYDWTSYGITLSHPNAYTVRLTGPSRNVFTDQYYKFVLPDLSQQILPADTTTPFLSIVRYKKPSSNSVTVSYPFAVTIPATYGSGTNTVENTTISHTFWWSVSVAQANVSRLKSQGLR